MKILIVEDEDLAALSLKKILEEFDPAIQILGVIQTVQDLKKWMGSGEQADLIFCDIELRDGQVLSLLKDSIINAPVVFTTAYDQYWQSALETHGIDYLLKPITEEKIHTVLRKVSSLKKIFNGGEQELLSQLTRQISNNITRNFKKRFPVRLNNELFIVDVDEIMYFKIINGIILAFTEEQRKLPITEQTLNEVEAVLDPDLFFRINRSVLVHIKYIESIQLVDSDDYIIKIKKSAEKLEVSSSRIAQLKNWIR